jgi:hypothetical protein
MIADSVEGVEVGSHIVQLGPGDGVSTQGGGLWP